MELVSGPALEARPAIFTLGVREIVPFRGMISARDRLWDELFGELKARNLSTSGDVYLRLIVIDMAGSMDIEAGIVTQEKMQGGGRIVAGEFPAGRYVTLTHRDHSIRANKTLLEWAKAEGLTLDRRDTPEGDRFACRYERIVSDREPRRKQWAVQLNIRIAD